MTRRRPRKRLSPSQLPSGMPMTVLMSSAVPLTRSVSVTISTSAGLLRTRRMVSMGYLLTLSVTSWAWVLDADARRFTLILMLDCRESALIGGQLPIYLTLALYSAESG